MKTLATALAASVLLTALAHPGISSAAPGSPSVMLILADTTLLREARIPVLDSDPATGVSLAEISSSQEGRLRELAHERRKCGGFELLSVQPWMSRGEQREFGRQMLLGLGRNHQRMELTPADQFPPVVRREAVVEALAQVSESNLLQTVQWLSSFETRFHKGKAPNVHVEELKTRIESMLATARWPYQVELVSHQYTPQKSLRVRIPGRSRTDEIVVIGAHLDSISQQFWASEAPGADDNASGSANILEALRVLASQQRPDRTIEFFWYAGEEGGLIGSSEIAKSYARAGKKVIAALQLDMTLFAGDGEFVLGSMTDFTNPALRQWLAGMNQAYLGAKIIEDKCGYGCSDHASWHSNGYPALMPFEATFDRMWPNLHTARDVIGPELNFRHSAMFSKLALAFAMELGGS